MPEAIRLYQTLGPAYFLIAGGRNGSVSWGEVMQAQALAAGIPARLCLVEDQSTSTYTNFEFMLPIIEQHHLHQIVVCTSWYHTRRSRWVSHFFQRRLHDVRFYTVPTEAVPLLGQRFSRLEFRYIFSEWGKLIWYGFRHRLYFG